MSTAGAGEKPGEDAAQRGPLPVTVIDDAKRAQAWAHPLRIRVMLCLEQETMSTKELADALGDDVTLENVAYHVRRLRDLGFIAVDRVERHRGRDATYYRAAARPQIGAEAWAQLPAQARATASGTYLQQVMQVAAAAHQHDGFEDPDSWIARSPLTFDDQGFAEASQTIHRLLTELDQISARAVQRVRDEGTTARPGTFVGLLFDTPPAHAIAGDQPD